MSDLATPASAPAPATGSRPEAAATVWGWRSVADPDAPRRPAAGQRHRRPRVRTCRRLL